jgi:hypothetical protein
VNAEMSLIQPRIGAHQPLILPRQTDRDVTPIDEDEAGEDEVPCDAVDDDETQCPICSFSNSGAGGFVETLNQTEDNLTGSVAPEEIYRIMHSLYIRTVKEPLELQKKKVPEISIGDIRNHFMNHRMNIRTIVGKEILFVCDMQRQLRTTQLAVVNLKTGKKRLLIKGISQWQRLSKHKLELIKYHVSLSKKNTNSKTNALKPYEFQ